MKIAYQSKRKAIVSTITANGKKGTMEKNFKEFVQ